MNEVILMVGPQGAGKSSAIKKWKTGIFSYFVISQDEMGPKKHLEEYEAALKRGEPSIVIDRINHTRDQRKRYTDLAKQYGYRTEIFVMNETFGTCFERIIKREDHPTIKSNDRATAIQALKMYFTQYERPRPEEADTVFYQSAYDPYLLDLNSMIQDVDNRRFIVIGDLHGCYDELVELLNLLHWDYKKDIIILTGDIIDRGPKIKECLNFAMTAPNVFTIMSNHEHRLARHLATLGADLVSKIKFSHGFMQTIDQCKDMFDDRFLGWIWSLPYMIKFGKNYVVHAGVNPRYPMHRQSKDFLMYARKYDMATNSYSVESAPNWYAYPPPPGLEGKVFFGHDVHEKQPNNTEHAVSVDGGCVFGEVLRAAVVIGESVTIVEVPSKQPKEIEEPMYTNWREPYEELVKEGYLSKQETPDLVLYNYTDKCVFDKKWNKYTLESRGIIFEKSTGLVVMDPFSKFFNIGETDDTRIENLPNEPYECFEKMDGSMGSIFNYRGKWQTATRGSFASDQAIKAQGMLSKYKMELVPSNINLITEIIYPANRNMPGARLVIDYGEEEFLCLLAAKDRTCRMELSRDFVETIGKNIGMPVVTKYDHTIKEMIAMQKTLPKEKEGFVARFKSGFRVKIKGEEYMKLHRILNSITPLFIYELMIENPEFIVPSSYMMSVPEEYRDEVLDIVYKLMDRRTKLMEEIETESMELLKSVGVEATSFPPEGNEWKKTVGMKIQSKDYSGKHASAMFPLLTNNAKALDKYVFKMIRPNANIL